MNILDDPQRFNQFDPQHALDVAGAEPDQLHANVTVEYLTAPAHPYANVILTGMGGSALSGLFARTWLDLPIPFEVARNYTLPAYANEHTLVIASSYSGNTEETLSALADAERRGAQVGILASGGTLLETARTKKLPHVAVPAGLQPRMALFYNLLSLVTLLDAFGVTEQRARELPLHAQWLADEAAQWGIDQPLERNLAKQLAEKTIGKSVVIYSGPLASPAAYKWKISFNENTKNVAFWNVLPEFNHNEFIGWSSHPIEKPYAVFDLISNLEHPRVLKRFEITDRLLSGMRPAATRIDLKGETLLQQLLWGAMLADFVTVYAAILNGVNPTPVELVERLKHELTR